MLVDLKKKFVIGIILGLFGAAYILFCDPMLGEQIIDFVTQIGTTV